MQNLGKKPICYMNGSVFKILIKNTFVEFFSFSNYRFNDEASCIFNCFTIHHIVARGKPVPHLRVNFFSICNLTQRIELHRAETILMDTRSSDDRRNAGVDRHTVLSEASEMERR